MLTLVKDGPTFERLKPVALDSFTYHPFSSPPLRHAPGAHQNSIEFLGSLNADGSINILLVPRKALDYLFPNGLPSTLFVTPGEPGCDDMADSTRRDW